jgi:flagellar biosynthesis chaperone FliJ
VIKEVIVEKEIIKEVPVEIIKEIEKVVEVIKEVPVEKVVEIIKEVPVDRVIEKEIFITDNQQINELGEKITRLEENIFHLEKQLEEERKIFSIKTQELEKIFQKEMSKKDVELDEVRRNLDIKLDNTNEKMLQETLQKLRKELLEKDEKIKELTKLNQDQQNTKESKLNAIFLKGSNLK